MDILSNKTCVWVEKCYQKQQFFASKATTHLECQTYLSSCTLSNSGVGCVFTKCIADGYLCGWDGYQCVDKSCLTASNQLKTTSECQAYLEINNKLKIIIPQFVANNPIKVNEISIIMGCQDLPRNYRQRMSIENCEILRNGYPICLWNQTQIQQHQIHYHNLNLKIVSIFFLIIIVFQITIKIAKSQSCKNLVYQNFQLGSKIVGDCFWNGQECVDRICENLKLITHIDCNAYQLQCTVNNCKITSERKYCIWTGFVCRSATCFDASDSLFYDTDEECQNYASNEKCTTNQQIVQSIRYKLNVIRVYKIQQIKMILNGQQINVIQYNNQYHNHVQCQKDLKKCVKSLMMVVQIQIKLFNSLFCRLLIKNRIKIDILRQLKIRYITQASDVLFQIHNLLQIMINVKLTVLFAHIQVMVLDVKNIKIIVIYIQMINNTVQFQNKGNFIIKLKYFIKYQIIIIIQLINTLMVQNVYVFLFVLLLLEQQNEQCLSYKSGCTSNANGTVCQQKQARCIVKIILLQIHV
ncbi:unnamed protein product [Paramecium sonneborni]|uniref:Uncharacterized protein n=1 Tax=Paramecium sonneborni TaxID=65129 RepID=A0A8S1RM13_9CILI|nr:unnamed protein product [Paramecium sonneborni]